MRIGIVSNQENHCTSPDSYIGIGGPDGSSRLCGGNHAFMSVGNFAHCQPDSGDRTTRAYGYVFVR